MNWKRVTLYVFAILLMPQALGFLFGFSSVLWQGKIAPETIYWLRVVLIGILLFIIYLRLSIIQGGKRFTHLAFVFLISQAITVAFEMGFSVPVVQTLAGLGENLLLVILALLIGAQLAKKQDLP